MEKILYLGGMTWGIIQGVFLVYCLGAGIGLSRLTRPLPLWQRILWVSLMVVLHMTLATYLENLRG